LQKNLEDLITQREAVRKIIAGIRRNINRKKALLKIHSSHIPQISKAQALIKGHQTRSKYKAIITRIKRESIKKTKKYQQISKLQANIKGFLHRQKIKKGLSKLKNKVDLDLDDDFDPETFIQVKSEHLNEGLRLPEEDRMK